MRKKRGDFIWLFILIIIFIAVNYNRLDSFVVKSFDTKEQVVVERVIDGDTVVVNGTSVRMLGINTPERGEYLYNDAKKYLEEIVMNKIIEIERRGKDLYKRDLGYLFYNNENVNMKMIESGYANAYFPEGKDEYYNEFTDAWDRCISKNINLCEKSKDKCVYCIHLKQFEYGKSVILYNNCDFSCNITGWSIKDEGRKKFVFNNLILNSFNQVSVSNSDFKEEYVWTKTGDTLFLRDSKGKLVLWERY